MKNLVEIKKFDEYIDKFIVKDHINHAYLIETNSSNKLEIAKRLIEKIISYENEMTIENLEKNQDLLIVDTENSSIKTDDVEQLKQKLATKSIYNKKRFYIINNADKLNETASNKMLKFVEEPESDVIGVFTTDNKNKF